jgi:apolipoprotein D and lipocalin family protein
MRTIVLAAVLCLAGCSRNPVYRQSTEPLPIASVEQARYLGLWHQQARLPNRFERGCQRLTVAYAQREDGLIAVRTTCLGVDGEWRVATGVARLAGDAGEGKLEVTYFGPLWRDYWIVDRGADYSWSIVGEPEGRYLSVLTRAERITPAQRAAFERRIRELGYRPAEMVWARTS